MISNQTPGILKKIYPSLTWEKESSSEIYLTFDDGPHPEITPWVLEQLDAYEAKATFFCVGECLNQFKKIAEETINRGHKLANHTYHHEKGWKTSNDAYGKSVEKCNKVVNEIQKQPNKLFRPPYGRIRRNQILQLRSNFRIIMWSHLALDFKEKLNISKSIRKLKAARPGSIIVFHDNEKSFENLRKMLPECLAHWSSLNYKFAVL